MRNIKKVGERPKKEERQAKKECRDQRSDGQLPEGKSRSARHKAGEISIDAPDYHRLVDRRFARLGSYCRDLTTFSRADSSLFSSLGHDNERSAEVGQLSVSPEAGEPKTPLPALLN